MEFEYERASLDAFCPPRGWRQPADAAERPATPLPGLYSYPEPPVSGSSSTSGDSARYSEDSRFRLDDDGEEEEEYEEYIYRNVLEEEDHEILAQPRAWRSLYISPTKEMSANAKTSGKSSRMHRVAKTLSHPQVIHMHAANANSALGDVANDANISHTEPRPHGHRRRARASVRVLSRALRAAMRIAPGSGSRYI